LIAGGPLVARGGSQWTKINRAGAALLMQQCKLEQPPQQQVVAVYAGFLVMPKVKVLLTVIWRQWVTRKPARQTTHSRGAHG